MHIASHCLSAEFQPFCTGSSQRYPHGVLRRNIRESKHGVSPERAKRLGAGTREPLLIRSLGIIQGGTSVKSNSGLVDAARKHLDLVRQDHERMAAQDRLYVTAAYTYGIEPEEIAAATGLSMAAVRVILTGGAD
jgi:hypothetical protein